MTRRESLQRMGTGLGVLGLAGILAQDGTLASSADADSSSPLAPKAAHFAPRAKHVIHLFMNGGPSQVDTFDPKPALTRYNGQRPPTADLKTERKTGGLLMSPFEFKKYGESGIEVSDLFPHVGECIDDICVIRSMHTDIPNHEPSLLMMNSGETQPTRPAMGSWLLYGLGTENQTFPVSWCFAPENLSSGRSCGVTVFCLASFRAHTSTMPAALIRRKSFSTSTIRI